MWGKIALENDTTGTRLLRYFYHCPFEFHQEISSVKGDIARFCYVATYGAIWFIRKKITSYNNIT